MKTSNVFIAAAAIIILSAIITFAVSEKKNEKYVLENLLVQEEQHENLQYQNYNSGAVQR